MTRRRSRSVAVELSPRQQSTFDGVEKALDLGQIVHVWGPQGRGKTTVLSALHREHGGVMLGIGDFVDRLSRSHPLQMEEALYRVLSKAMKKHPTVFLDDLHLVTAVLCCNYMYPRQNLIDTPLAVVAAHAMEKKTKLVFCHSGSAPNPLQVRAFSFGIGKLGPEDYRVLCRPYLSEAAWGRLDFARLHQFAPKLNGHQLRASCQWLAREKALDTDRFIDHVRSQRMATNVDIEEVETVSLTSLKGVDDVIQSLEANVVLPVERDALARELDLRPARGVLLVGPPGTGKTTIGKALAHRLRGKFFLIDGTYISGTRDFYGRVHRVFEAAKENAPSIVFIDDSDVIFENSQESGLYRYLLTQLDGLEGKGKGNVCVILTAMDVGALPPALIRSGRIELWLETRLPDAAARGHALAERLQSFHASFRGVDLDRLVAVSEGFTGADLKGLMERGKMNLAYDRARGAELMEPTAYFLAAAETIRENQERYREAEARARARPRERPPWFYPTMEMESAEDYD